MDSSIKFNVSANTAQFQSGMRQVDTAAKSTAAGIKTAFAGVGSMLVGGAMVAGLKSLMNDFDKVAKVATRFGASAEEIQRVSVAADLAGTSIDTVARVLTKMSVAASDASTGNAAMAEAFERAGINAEKFKNSGLDQQLVLLSEAFNRARGNADATNQIIELMGTRAAGQMIPLIDNTAALRQEMEGVAVASDDVVRKIEAANDRMTRLGNDGKVAFAMLLEGIVNTSERLGSLLADLGNIAKLSAAASLALTGNIRPLWELLQTGKTIKEMEEIEARASAIAQLTNEGAFGFDAVRNAELIAERTAQILDQTRGTAQQIQIAEDSTDRVLGLEKEKTAELDRQQAALERQEEQRQRSIRSIEQEIRLMEAQLSGNKELEESLRQQADFDAVMEKTGNFETAANFAATKAAERQAQLAAENKETSNFVRGRGAFNPRDDAPTLGQAVAKMRADAARDRRMGRFDELLENRQFRSAARLQQSAERAANQILRNQDRRDALRDAFGADNAGEAARNLERDAFKAGMTFDEALSRMGIDRKVGEDRADALERFVNEQAKPEAQRLKEAKDAEAGQQGDKQKGAPDKGPNEKLDKIITIMQERLPIRVMGV